MAKKHGFEGLASRSHTRAAVLEAGPRSQLLRLAAVMPAGPVRCAVVNDLGLPAGVASNPPPEAGAALERIVDLDSISHRLKSEKLDDVRAAYEMPRGGTAVRDQRSTFAAIELLIHAGASVIFAQPAYTGRADRQFDTHDDDTGLAARAVIAPITPSLATFLDRTLAMPVSGDEPSARSFGAAFLRVLDPGNPT